ncbi:hypothetical protein SADUNF_Sadunf18G0073800 [Salix dunnii]|uniref:Uncharacterized protein n=1 Tax=Salix dunnii TaxID=1413687 RepID=A0A835J3P6_9ROSI|nr:hypothetical protein SADUNF_Sadunf18G0073800 [Salix dunnii]
MTSERIKTGREEKIVSLYQVDPAFYNKILSRNPSLKCSSSISAYRNPGEVPFTWEMQPGKPREASKTEIARPIRLPPAVHGLNMPKPRFHHSGPLAYLSKHVKKVKKIKNMQLRLPPAVPSGSIPRMAAKVKSLKCSEKVKKIKNIYLGKKWKAKPVETSTGFAGGTDESDGFRSCIDFTPSPSTSDASTLSSSFSFHQAKKSPRRFRSWNLSMELAKCRINK